MLCVNVGPCTNVNICVKLILINALYNICVFACVDFLFFFNIRANHTERDVNMKRQLVEDMKTRLKFLQEMEKSYKGQLEELEKKVHTTQHIAADAVITVSHLI